MGQRGVTAIRMPVEYMAALLPNDLETLFEQNALEGTRIHDRQLAHTAIENDCKPTNSGNALISSSLISSKQSSTTSFRFTCS